MRILTVVLGILITSAISSAPNDASAANDGPIDVTIGSTITVQADSARVSQLVLRVAGPGDFRVSERSEHGRLSWYLPAGAPDGEYRFDVYASPSSAAGDDGRGYYTNGRFTVEGGRLQSPSSGNDLAGAFLAPARQALRLVLTGLVPEAHAAGDHTSGDKSISGTLGIGYSSGENATADLAIDSLEADLRFKDEGTNVWRIVGRDGQFIIEDEPGGTIHEQRVFEIFSGAGEDGFLMSSNGLELMNGVGYFDASNSRFGVNTTSPGTTMHIASGELTTNLRLDNPARSQVWDFEVSANGLLLKDITNGATPFTVRSGASPRSLVVAGTENNTAAGDIGIGTILPDHSLHVQRSDGSAKVLVEETSSTTATRDLMGLKNNGVVLFGMENTDTGDIWDFSNRTSGFAVTLRGSGGSEMLVQQDGTFRVGPGNEWRFVVQPSGDARLDGTLTEGSSREIKENIEGISEREVLAKLDKLPLSEWQYKEGNGSRHMGPMAEDFHATFGLGPDAKHIAPKDLAGVAMASAKALKDELEATKEKFEATRNKLEAKNKKVEELESRLARVEKMLEKDGK